MNPLDDRNYPYEPGAGTLWAWGIFSLAVYLILGRLPADTLQTQSADMLSVTRFLVLIGCAFGWYWILVSRLIKGWRLSPRQFGVAIGFALVFRVVLLPSPMILENDIYRYQWDGHTTLQGINPYRYAPLDAETQPYRTDYWERINYRYVPTIYPPVLQYVYTLSELFFPGHVMGMKLVMVLFDVGTLFLLIQVLRALRRPREWCLIYAWSPLVLKEIANSGHADSVCAFFLTLAMLFLARSQDLAGGVALAGMTLTKFFGILFLPLLRRLWRWPAYALFSVTALVLYLPFLSPGVNPFQGFLIFSREWRFNGGIFNLTAWLLQHGTGFAVFNPDTAARMLLLVVILLVTAWQAYRLPKEGLPEDGLRGLLVVMGTLLLCSPVINPWYFVWLLPLLCVFPHRSWILLTGLIFLSYTFYYTRTFPQWVPWAEYGTFFAVLLFERSSSRRDWRLY